MKKPWLIALIITLIVGLGGVGLYLKSRSKPAQSPAKLEAAANIVPLEDRPYVTLSPVTTGSHPAGTEVELTVHTTTLESTKAEYELEYQAGSLLQGAFGSLDFAKEPPPVSKTLLLGTCSAGGKCDYNENVSGGTITMRLSGGEKKFVVKGEWTYQLMSEHQGKFSSRDSKFRIDIGKSGLTSGAYLITMQPIGLPGNVDGEVVAGPYHLATAAKPSFKTASVEIRLSEAVEGATLLGWTGSDWKTYESSVSEKTLTSDIDRFTTFVVIKP